MKTFFDRLGAISISLLILFFFEGAITSGEALKFEEYGVTGWLVQGILVYLFSWVAVRIQEHA